MMNSILVKLFATALAFSQVATRPDAIKTQFDPAADTAEVVQLLRAGCAHMRKAFDIENLNLDDLISTAMDDPSIVAGKHASFHGLDFKDLYAAYREFCKNETPAQPVVDIGAVIAFYNGAAANLPDHTKLKTMRLPGMTSVLDGNGKPFAEVFEPRNRRIWVGLADIPKQVQSAFVAAEDKRFYRHHGIDERGLIRAFIDNLLQPGRLQGGSTITQQVAKNLLVGDDVTYERKIREILVASRIEHTLSKGEILDLYLNAIYLGRGAWGIEQAARSYFGKPARELTLAEGAQLAGLAKGPNYFSPDRHPQRAHERLAYVLNRMREDGAISAATEKSTLAAPLRFAAYDRGRRDTGFQFVDQIAREAKADAAIKSLTADSYTVRSTVLPALQRATEAALQEGLARYERNTGRLKFTGPEVNLAKAIERITTQKKDDKTPAWRRALAEARLPLYDVHWDAAVVIDNGRGKNSHVRVGLADGRVLPLRIWSAAIRRRLERYDVVFVHVTEAKGRRAAHATLRVRPQVQGAALVLENKTGRILAMAGSFSYPLSQLNRVTQSQRQPGSSFKPLVYLAALRNGLQPNTLVSDQPITFPPIGGDTLYARDQDYWTPQNYGGASSGVLTLRRALEKSRNLATAHLLEGGIASDATASLDRVCELAVAVRLYKTCNRYYPIILGAQGVRVVDLAAFYAAIANEGRLPAPHVIESIMRDGKLIYRAPDPTPLPIRTIDAAMMYQLKSMLQGVVARGTAVSIKNLAPYVAGKTGTSDDENDAWFVGFTNEVTVAVWVGYDNPGRTRRTLGHGETGAKVALPIFRSIIEQVWRDYAPRTTLSPPSPAARRDLIALPINLNTGDVVSNNSPGRFVEYFRRDANGEASQTQYALLSESDASLLRESDPGGVYAGWPAVPDSIPLGRLPAWREPPPPPPPPPRGLFSGRPWWDDEDAAERRARRFDPDYFLGRRQRYY
jgi:penicillin-binding protein 1A